MTSRKARLRRAAERMTPLQIVLADLEEGRRAGGFVAFGRLVAGRPYDPGNTLSAQAERSVRLHLKGRREEIITGAVRREQGEVLFLSTVARECMSAVVHSEREWFFRRCLLHEYLQAALDDQPGHDLARCVNAVYAHEFDLLRTAAAIRLIADVHFAGVDVLLPEERGRLDEEIEEVGGWTAAMRPHKSLRPTCEIPPVEPGAARLADDWCRMARSQVYWKQGEVARSIAELNPVVLGVTDDAESSEQTFV